MNWFAGCNWPASPDLWELVWWRWRYLSPGSELSPGFSCILSCGRSRRAVGFPQHDCWREGKCYSLNEADRQSSDLCLAPAPASSLLSVKTGSELAPGSWIYFAKLEGPSEWGVFFFCSARKRLEALSKLFVEADFFLPMNEQDWKWSGREWRPPRSVLNSPSMVTESF